MIMTVMLMSQKASVLQRSTMTPRRLSQYEVVCTARDESSAGILTHTLGSATSLCHSALLKLLLPFSMVICC